MATRSITKSVTWGVTGVTMFATVKSDGTQVRARSSTGVVEWPTGSGSYELEIDLDDTKAHQIAWDDGTDYTTEDFVVPVSDAGGGASASDIAAAIRAIIPTTVGNPFIATKDLAAIPAASAHAVQWTVLNSGAAVDLTGKTVRCVFALVSDAGDVDDRTDDTLTAEFSYQTGGDGIVISGTSGNIVTLTHSVTKTATPGAYKYWLWNITDNVVLARGRAPIEAAAKST